MRALPIVLGLLLAGVAHAQTNVPGGNLPTQTWTPAGSPYNVAGDITVPAGAVLTIDAGTVVRFASTDSIAASTISRATARSSCMVLHTSATRSSRQTDGSAAAE